MRIQILPLPSVVVGEIVEEPFALVVDQYDAPATEEEYDRWRHFKQECGARAVLVTLKTVEVVDRYAEPDASGQTALADKVRDVHRTQGYDGNWNFSEYMLGMYNGLELALSILEGEREPRYRDEPEGGYLCDRPTPDMSGPEFQPVKPDFVTDDGQAAWL